MDFKQTGKKVYLWENNNKYKIGGFPVKETSEALENMIYDENGEYEDCFSMHKKYYVRNKNKRENSICVRIGVVPEEYKKDPDIKRVSVIITRGNNNSAKLNREEIGYFIEKILGKDSKELFKNSLVDRVRHFKVKKKRENLIINGEEFLLDNIIESTVESLSNDTPVTKIKSKYQIHSYKNGLTGRTCIVCGKENRPCKCFRSLNSNPLYIICDDCLNLFAKEYLNTKVDIILKSVAESI